MNRLVNWDLEPELHRLVAKMSPPKVIPRVPDPDPYLSRYYLVDRSEDRSSNEPLQRMANVLTSRGLSVQPSVGVYLHRFHRGDAERELHSHPWLWSASVILSGGYVEERRTYSFEVETRSYGPGDTNMLAATDFYRVDLVGGRECWTLFVAGPKLPVPEEEAWGFWNRDTGQYWSWAEFGRMRSKERRS